MLELYQAEDCPYSEKVREAAQQLGISYVVHNPRSHAGDVKNAQTYEQLTAVGGQDQIPCLIDTDRREILYESEDIIEYLQAHYG